MASGAPQQPAGALRRSLGESLRSSVTFDRSALAPLPALRGAVGIAIALGGASALFGLPAGVAAAVGALLTGLPAVAGTNRRPLRTMIAIAVAVAVSIFVASASAQPLILHLGLLGLWAFAGGLLVALGDAAAVVGLQAMVTFIVFAEIPAGPAGAARLAALAVAGGGVQIALVAVTRGSSIQGRRRLALASAYRALARGAAGDSSLAAGEALDAAALALNFPTPFRRTELAPMRSLVTAGRRIRVQLAGLSGLSGQLRRRQRADQALTDVVERCRESAAAILDLVGESLVDPSPKTEQALSADFARFGNLLAELDALGAGPDPAVEAIRAGIRESLGSLAGQLRAARALVARTTTAGGEPPERGLELGARGWRLDGLWLQLERLAANLTPKSTAWRHALRLAVLLLVATVVGEHLPFQRGYWVPLTVAIVLKPDFAATFTRGWARLLGTLVGAGLVGLVAELLRPRGPLELTLIVIFALAAYLVFAASYAAFSVFITGLVVLLVSLDLPGTLATTGDRLIDTVIGGALAMLAYSLWPSWSTGDATRALASLVHSETLYVGSVLRSVTGLRPGGESELAELARTMRLDRSNAEAAVTRAVSEPTAQALRREWAAGLFADLRRVSQVAHALRSRYAGQKLEAPTKAVAELVDGLEEALRLIEEAVLWHRLAAPLPPLRRLQEAVAGTSPAAAADPFLVAQVDEMVDAIDAVAEVLSDPA